MTAVPVTVTAHSPTRVLRQTYSELQQAIFDRFEVVELDGAAFLRAKSAPITSRNAAIMPVELVASPGAHTTSFSGNENDQPERRPLTVFVPPENEHRCLILCFDDTSDQFDANNSSITQLVSALKMDDRTKQIVYYQSRVGTYTSSSKVVTYLQTKIWLALDTAIARNLSSQVMSGYEFLMQNHTAGDRICIFGFSRGAYIARSLAGMIHRVGLLPVDNHQQIPFAYRMYARADAVGWAQSNAFKKAFSNDVHIDFIGVWDTVDSVGFIPKRLPFTTSDTTIRTFRHAVSLDERRAKFKTNLWNFPNDAEKKLGTHTPPEPPTFARKFPGNLPMSKVTKSDEDERKQMKFKAGFAEPHRKPRPTDILEVWFAGCHTDVGGRSVRHDTRHSLARIPLRWMIRECFKADTGIMFNAERLQELGLDPTTLYPFVLPRPPPLPFRSADKIETIPPHKGWLRRVSRNREKGKRGLAVSRKLESTPLEMPRYGMEEEEDLRDALQPIRYRKRNAQWVTKFRANMGRPREIPHQKYNGVNVHRSVKTRLEARDAQGRRYIPRARLDLERVIWVD